MGPAIWMAHIKASRDIAKFNEDKRRREAEEEPDDELQFLGTTYPSGGATAKLSATIKKEPNDRWESRVVK